jgi:hypothetical protein
MTDGWMDGWTARLEAFLPCGVLVSVSVSVTVTVAVAVAVVEKNPWVLVWWHCGLVGSSLVFVGMRFCLAWLSPFARVMHFGDGWMVLRSEEDSDVVERDRRQW